MTKTPKTWLALLLSIGFSLGMMPAADASTASTTKKKPVAAKKASQPGVKTAKKPATKATRVAKRTVPAPVAAAADAQDDGTPPKLASSAVAVIDQSTGDVLYEKNANAIVPIASITKLMTAMVVLDAQPSLSEPITISREDLDMLKGTSSRLAIGTTLSREEMLRLALMSSENRASSALARYYPGGRDAFIAAMNQKARDLGMTDSRFHDATGLTPANVASARDLAKLVDAAHQYPLIREFSTSEEYQVAIRGRAQTFRNTNALVRNDTWQIGLSKTGYISEAGKCLVMQVWLNNKPTIIVLLDSWGKLTRIGDAQRIKRWVEHYASGANLIRG